MDDSLPRQWGQLNSSINISSIHASSTNSSFTHHSSTYYHSSIHVCLSNGQEEILSARLGFCLFGVRRTVCVESGFEILLYSIHCSIGAEERSSSSKGRGIKEASFFCCFCVFVVVVTE